MISHIEGSFDMNLEFMCIITIYIICIVSTRTENIFG